MVDLYSQFVSVDSWRSQGDREKLQTVSWQEFSILCIGISKRSLQSILPQISQKDKKSLKVIVSYFIRNFFNTKSLLQAIPEIKTPSDNYCENHENCTIIDFAALTPIISQLSTTLESLFNNCIHPYCDNITDDDRMKFIDSTATDDFRRQLLPMNQLRPISIKLTATYLRDFMGGQKEMEGNPIKVWNQTSCQERSCNKRW